MTRPHHLNPRLVLVVALGGAVGTSGRYGLSKVVDPWHGIPLATLIVNLVGAFLLGVLLELLIRAGRETSQRRVIRLGFGTGGREDRRREAAPVNLVSIDPSRLR